MKYNKNKCGMVFWITGLSGSGKSTISESIKSNIIKMFGPTLLFHGDDLRSILKLNKFDKTSRLKNGEKFCRLIKYISEQNVNVIISLVGMHHSLREWNKKNLKKYIEIYIKSDLKKIINLGEKKVYNNYRKKKNIVGISIKPDLPKKPDITLINNFDKKPRILGNDLLCEIKSLVNKKFEK